MGNHNKIEMKLLVLACLLAVAAADLKVDTVSPGDCSKGKAEVGKKTNMHYTGRLTSNGQKFDSSLDRGQPFQFTLGVGQVIQGWDKGVPGMCVGEKRKLTIPAEMGYGARGAGGVIPPNAELEFDIEFLGQE